MNEYRKAFRIIWNIISILILLSIVIIIFVPQPFILKSLPVCEWQRVYDKPCYFCGMGRALTSLAHGHIYKAISFNWLSIPFVILLLANEIIWVLNRRKKS